MSNDKVIDNLGKSLTAANYRAINRAAKTALVAARRFIRTMYAISKAELDLHMKISRMADKKNPFVVISVSRNSIELIKFSAVQVGQSGRSPNTRKYTASGRIKKSFKLNVGQRLKEGVKAMEKRGKKKLYRSPYAGAFITKVKSGSGTHEGVFIRKHGTETMYKHKVVTKKGVYIKEYRGEKFRQMYGPALTSLIVNKSGTSKVVDEIKKVFQETYEKRLVHELQRTNAASEMPNV